MGIVNGVGTAVGGVGGLGTPAGLTELMRGVVSAVADDHHSNQQVLQSVKNDLENNLKQMEQSRQLPAVQTGGPVQVLSDFQSNLTRLAYIAALHKAVKRAKHSRAFNLETAMNDLWTALNNIKQGNQANATTTAASMNRNAQVIELMNRMVKQMSDSSSASIRNLAP